jgi:stage II sporulation protein D
VLSKELYRNWAPETYRALAVAARTFAMYHMITFGARNEYDLGDTQASQVYGGLSAETESSWEAVRYTHGTVLAYGEPGQERIFMAQYSACCGGRVNGAYVIRNAHRIPPLSGGQACTDCSACRQYRWASVRVAKSDVYRALAARYSAVAALGSLSAIRVRTTTPHGRAVWVEAVGPDGRSARVRAEDVRLAMLYHGVPAARRLYSMNCRIVDRGRAIEFADGQGFGHGVGLCQWGAQGKAMKGWTAEQILQFYYPGATLYRVH